MPYQRKYKPMPRRNKLNQATATARKAYNIASKVASVVNVERKQSQLFVNGATISESGGYSIVRPVNGTKHYERIGNSILLKQLHIKGYLDYNGADCFVRICIIWDKSDTIGSTANLLQDSGLVTSVFSHYDRGNRKQFTVVYDKTFWLDSNNPTQIINIKKNLNKHVTFIEGSSDVQTNALKMFIWSNQSATYPKEYMYHQITYIDN